MNIKFFLFSLFLLLFSSSAFGQGSCIGSFQYTLGNCPSVSFFDGSFSSSGASIINWNWDFGDGNTSTMQNPTHTYTSNGFYLVCLNILTSDSCTATYCDTFNIGCIVPQGCQAAFQFDDSSCPTVNFVDGSSATPGIGISGWFWDFGDGNTSSLQNPAHTYAANGSYTVCLTVTTPTGCFDSVCQTVNVNCVNPPGCQAAFQYDDSSCPTVSFFDGSSGTPGPVTNWLWDFGDGNFSFQQNPTHTYAANGTYTVCLTSSTAACTDSVCQTVTINCIGTSSCQSFFQYTLGQCPTVSFFDGSTSTPGSIINWQWDFGDGSSSNLQNPSYTYGANGTYLACLTIMTDDNCTSTFCDTVFVGCISAPSCQTAFQFDDTNCPTVDFFDASFGNPGPITSWLWDFGDGNISFQQNPSHTYAQNGTYTVCLTSTTAAGCTDSACQTVTINCINPVSCNAGFQYTLGQCPTVSFFDGSTSTPGSVVNWQWDFGDGGTSGAQNPSHTYTANGTYLVCLTIFTSDSCTSTFCDTVNVSCITPPSCQASFGYDDQNCPTVDFFDASFSFPGIPVAWQWDFGDGGTSGAQNPSHTYTANGTYLVCLTIFTSDSCTSTFCDTVFVGCISAPSCQAAFQFDDTNCPTVDFFDASFGNPGPITSWFWDFGDGNISFQQNPSHTYAQNGTYTVCLTSTTAAGCTDSACQTVTINCINPVSCNAGFQYTLGQCPTVSFFDGSTSTPGSVVNWQWDFGDGGTSGAQNPSHTYTANGTYLVCLTIFTSDSCTSTFCDTVNVSCITPPSCQASFGYDDQNCPTVDFFDASFSFPGIPVAWQWDFGDGGTSGAQNPSHTYTANGTYLVCLTIFTSDSCTSTFCDTVFVGCISAPSCQAAFQFDDTNCPTVDFFDASFGNPGPITSWFWDFGDGNISFQQNPSHTYAQNGTYTVCLTSTTAAGCTDSACQTVTINCINPVSCNAGFQYTLGQCPTVSFFDGSTSTPGSVVNWQWDFGDGGTSGAQNPSHTYTANGTYLVCLTIFTSDSCTSTFCDTVNVSCITPPSCQASFGYDDQNCPTVDFFDASFSFPGIPVAWQWDFGDGGTSGAQNPSHTYTANGTYLVCLTIFTSDSCTDTFCDTVSIGCINPVSCSAGIQYNTNCCPRFDFFDASISTPGFITNWLWDFGDGAASILPNPSHVYTSNGTYILCLTINTSDGCTDTWCDTLVVDCIIECKSEFTYTAANCPSVTFNDNSSSVPGFITDWSWDFGDGNTSALQNPTHTYAADSSYTVCLTITTSDGCINTSCQTININCLTPPPCGTDTYEPNDTQSMASLIGTGSIFGFKNKLICGINDVDWFKYNNNASGKTLKISLSSLPANYGMEVYDASGLIASSTNPGTTPEVIKIPNAAAGMYWVRVFGQNGAWHPTIGYNLVIVSAFVKPGSGIIKPAIINPAIIRKADPEEGWEVYPNPVSDQLFIAVPENVSEEVQLNLVNIHGQEIQLIEAATPGSTLEIEITGLSAGLYFIQAIDKESGVLMKRKLVIEK